MPSTNKSKQTCAVVFPEQGKFPSVDEFRRWMVHELERKQVTAYALSMQISDGSNPNLVGEFKSGKNRNPKAQTMKAIFDALVAKPLPPEAAK